VAFRYRSMQQFTKWLAAEGELDADPMADMRAPHVPEEPVPILTPDDLKSLLATCKGRALLIVGTRPSSGCSWTRACAWPR
jgi:site-specific recombinase XerC